MESNNIFEPHLTKEERIQLLISNSERIIENKRFYRPLTPEEVQQLEKNLKSKSIELQALEEEKQDFVDNWKAKYKPILESKNSDLRELRFGTKEEQATVYEIYEVETNNIKTVDANGFTIETRKALPGERKNIFAIANSNTGTNG